MRLAIARAGFFELSEAAEMRLGAGEEGYVTPERHDPRLLEVIESMGPAAALEGCEIAILEIPDGTEYYVDQLGGREVVHERHRVWWHREKADSEIVDVETALIVQRLREEGLDVDRRPRHDPEGILPVELRTKPPDIDRDTIIPENWSLPDAGEKSAAHCRTTRVACGGCGKGYQMSRDTLGKRLDKFGGDVARMNAEWRCQACRRKDRGLPAVERKKRGVPACQTSAESASTASSP